MSIRERYFRPSQFESTKLYKALGVTVFNRYINPNSASNRLTDTYRAWRSPNGNFGGLPPARNTLDSIRAFERRSKRNELSHMVGLAVNGLIGLVLHKKDAPLWLQAGNVAGAVICNLYPVALQRHNRIRTTHVRELLEAREAARTQELPHDGIVSTHPPENAAVHQLYAESFQVQPPDAVSDHSTTSAELSAIE